MKKDKVQRIELGDNGVYMRHLGIDVFEQGLKELGLDIPRPYKPVVILPGGGYFIIGTTEAWPVADLFAENGYYPFILSYSVSDGSLPFDPKCPEEFPPVQDLLAALKYIKEEINDPLLAKDAIVAGFSAGGHVTAMYSALRKPDWPSPEALLLAYPLIRMNAFERDGFHLLEEIKDNFPPTFLWHGENDSMVPFEDSVLLAATLDALGCDVEFLSTDDAMHANPFYNDFWIKPAFRWLASRGHQC